VIRRLVITALVAVALVGVVVAFSSSRRPPNPATSAVIETYPPEGDLDLRQVTVGAKLAPGYTGDLFVDGQQVPEDELHREPALYTLTLQPLPDSSYKLGPGRHCATVRYWPLAQPNDKRDSRPWCFNLH
jgi:hypothetical protein